ncbi:PDR/VanB family oxidoreductase [Stutzerimonas chloritidismutans]|uniref:PDR/VanB family oxidoreductase n=1 Tax=Stutzerimonas chloritidismutans TaxID=203192 RepID=A0ABU9M9M8_STUCH
MNQSWIEVRVARRTPVAENIVALELVAVNDDWLPTFSAGAHVDLELPNGLVRQYSLCSAPARRDRYEVGVLLDPTSRGGSRCVHEQLQEGVVLRISPPRNLFALKPARHSILLAGGIGITPLLCMAEHLSTEGASFELHYCSRSPARTAFVERLRASAFANQVHFHFDEGDAALRVDLNTVLAEPASDRHLYVCGPRGFMDHVIETATELGWPEGTIHFESFSGAVVECATDGCFDVQLASTGQVVLVKADQSVAEALLAAGVEVPLSCEQGICGTCVMRVLEGEVEHRDMALSDEERVDRFTPCCSRAKAGRLVIDHF